MSHVLIVGLGYVGLPLAARAAQVGHTVIGVDLDPRKLNSLREGRTYIEDVTDAEVKSIIDSGRLRVEPGWFSVKDVPESVKGFDIAVITVPTPLDEETRTPNLGYVESAGIMLGRAMTPGCAIVLESTTYPGTTENLLGEVLAKESSLAAGFDFHLGFSPERIDPGNQTHTLRNTPKLVSATTPEGLHVIKRFYDTIVDRTVPVSNPRVAELTKLYENIQANVNIALINEVAELSHDLDIDVWEMIDASMTKGHSMARWTPGPGVGGHCLPIDPMYLAWQARTQLDKHFEFAELADEINHRRPVYVAKRVKDMLEEDAIDLRGTEVLILGVAYKPNVGDTRESPAIEVIEALKKRGARVTAVDPHVEDRQWTHCPLLPVEELYSRLETFPVSVIVTDHADFDYDKIADLVPRLLDCRNAVSPGRPNVEAL